MISGILGSRFFRLQWPATRLVVWKRPEVYRGFFTCKSPWKHTAILGEYVLRTFSVGIEQASKSIIYNLMSRKMHMSDYLPSRHFQIFVMIHDHLVTHVASIDRVYICSQILTNTSLSQAVLSFKLVGITIFRYIYLDPPRVSNFNPPRFVFGGKKGPKFQTLGGFS